MKRAPLLERLATSNHLSAGAAIRAGLSFQMKRADSASPEPAIQSDEAAASMAVSAQENAELKEQIRKLLDLKECRSAMISHLAHELRTPLTSILGFSEILLSQERLTDAQRGFCERIQNSAHQLQRNLNELADLARMDIPQGDGEPPDDA